MSASEFTHLQWKTVHNKNIVRKLSCKLSENQICDLRQIATSTIKLTALAHFRKKMSEIFLDESIASVLGINADQFAAKRDCDYRRVA